MRNEATVRLCGKLLTTQPARDHKDVQCCP